MRTLLMAVLTTCCFTLSLTPAAANEPVKKAAVREIDLKEYKRTPSKLNQKPAVISNIGELAESLGMCLKEQLPYQLAKEVDFEKERLLFFAWSGSEDDKLTYEVKCCPKHRDDVTAVTFQYQRGATESRRSHFRLVVVPKNTPWSVATENMITK